MPRNSQQTTDMPQTKTVAVAAAAASTATPAPVVAAQPSGGDATVKRVRRPKGEAETAAAAPAPAQATPAPAAAEATPAPKAARVAKATVAPAVAAPAAAQVAPVASGAGAAESSSDESVSEIDSLRSRLTAALDAVRVEKARLQEVGKTLVTLVEGLVRDTNTVLRKSLRRKRRTGSNSNSGFLKPKLVTQELCAFLERPAGTQMSRTEVTRSICDYIKRNELQDKKNRRIIVPDQRLSGLLKLEKGQTLTYFDLQSKMNHLFASEETA